MDQSSSAQEPTGSVRSVENLTKNSTRVNTVFVQHIYLLGFETDGSKENRRILFVQKM